MEGEAEGQWAEHVTGTGSTLGPAVLNMYALIVQGGPSEYKIADMTFLTHILFLISQRKE